ncbi:MAG: alkaline phosphatase family protein [Gemmatimonadales bacterium]
MFHRCASLVVACLLAATPPLVAQGKAPKPTSPKPIRLVVAIAIDQMRPDYLDRFRGDFRGGLAMLLRDGVFFRNGEQDHGVTETAPGHATMMTGRTPAHVGIVYNDLGVPDLLSPLIRSTATGASPRRMIGSTLFDWMLARDSSTRALSVSRKDRGAILPMGRAKVPVYWFSKGIFTTSRWYADSLPTWVTAWDARDPVGRLRGSAWTLERDPSAYPEADDRPFEVNGADRLFPHLLSTDSATAIVEIEKRPAMDSLTLDFAFTGVKQLQLGTRNGTDFLSLSLSTTDAVGHRWGPGSREIHDQLLKLDRYLGAFFDSLATIVPPDQMVVSLTADHGVTEYPEAGVGGRVVLSPLIRTLNGWVRARYRIEIGAGVEAGLIYGDRPALASRGVNVDSLDDALAAEARKIPGVRRVFTNRSLAAAKANDRDAVLWRSNLPPTFGWFIVVVVDEHFIFGSGKAETSHGTLNSDDMRVPILFRVPGVAPRRVERVIRTVDIAPTLAQVLGVRPTERLDGVPLPELFGRRPTR